MNIKQIKNCREGGQRSWFLLTCDYASLEARLAAIDTFMNNNPTFKYVDEKSSEQYMPDPVLLDVYKDGSPLGDLHSMTGFGTFVGSIHMKAIRVHDDVDDKDYVFAPMSKCKVLREGKEIIVNADDLLESDHILEHMKK